MTNKDGGPAFPLDVQYEVGNVNKLGMSLRDYFAAKAMPAIIKLGDCDRKSRDETLVIRAYEIADAMLLEREKGSK